MGFPSLRRSLLVLGLVLLVPKLAAAVLPPIPTAPGNGQRLYSTQIQFTWIRDIANADFYRFRLYAQGNLVHEVLLDGLVDSYTLNGFPNNGEAFTWEMCAQGFDLSFQCGNIVTFYSGPSAAPGAVSISIPNPSGTQVTFNFSAPLALWYDFYLDYQGQQLAEIFDVPWSSTGGGVTITGLPDNGAVFDVSVYACNSPPLLCTLGTTSFSNGPSALPGTPVPISPPNGSNVYGPTVDFEWTPAARAADYRLEVWTPNAPLFDQYLGGPIVGVELEPLPANDEQIFWEVRARNALGDGVPSSTRTFTSRPDAPPGPFSLVAPSGAAAGEDVVFSWTSSEGAASYRLQIGTHPSELTPGNLAPLDIDLPWYFNSALISGLPNNGITLYWRVYAINSYAGGSTRQSPIASFANTPDAPPGPPTLYSPVGFEGVADPVVFDFDPGARAFDHDLEISTNSSFSFIWAAGTVPGPFTLTDPPLPGRDNPMWWRLRATNALGSSSWVTQAFTSLPNAPPAAPVPTMPSGNVPGSTVLFAWEFDAYDQAAQYHLEIAFDPAFQAGISYPIPSLTEDGIPIAGVNVSGFGDAGEQFYWRVYATNSLGASAYSSVQTFVNGPSTVPGSITILSPLEGAQLSGNPVALDWTAAASALSYQVDVAFDAGFSSLVTSGSVSSSGATLPALAEDGTRYYWRVRGQNPLGYGPYAYASFVLGEPEFCTEETLGALAAQGLLTPSLLSFCECIESVGVGQGTTGFYTHLDTCKKPDEDVWRLLDKTRRIDNDLHGHDGLMKSTFFTKAQISTEFFGSGIAEVADTNAWTGTTEREMSSVDAHVTTAFFYDLLLDRLGVNGQDDEGGTMTTVVDLPFTVSACQNSLGGPVVQAFHLNGKVYYCRNSGLAPFTATHSASPDVGGHEWGHGVTRYAAVGRSGTIDYEGASGAINESFSDMIGTYFEFAAIQDGLFAGTANYTLGELSASPPFRDMANPHTGVVSSQPDHLASPLWINPATCSPGPINDYCGIHRNSGIPNKMFYLLAEGGTFPSAAHQTSQGYSATVPTVTVSGIGIDKAMIIALEANLKFWSGDVDFGEARDGMIQAAEFLRSSGTTGFGQEEVHQVRNAWAAVGVGDLQTVTVATSDPVRGSVSGGGETAWGAATTVVATANPGFAFTHWEIDGTEVSTLATYTFEPQGDVTVVAHFAIGDFTVSATVSPAGSGFVNGTGAYRDGDLANLWALGTTGLFSGWTGDIVSAVNPLVFTVDQDTDLVAHFVQTPYVYSALVYPQGAGFAGVSTTDGGTTVRFSASPAAGYQFVQWMGDLSSTQATVVVPGGSDLSAEAIFAPNDTTAPTVTAPAGLQLEASSVLTVIPDLGSASAIDDVDGALTPTPNYVGPFPLGITQVIWSATDSAGNTGTATQQVQIVDTTPPVLAVPAGFYTGGEVGGTAVDLGVASATDIFPVTIVNDSPGIFQFGNTTVTWTATDSSGNQASAVQQVFLRPYGDLNANGIVNTADALLALRFLSVGLPPALLGIGDVAPVVDGQVQPNGIFDVGDVLLILKRSGATSP